MQPLNEPPQRRFFASRFLVEQEEPESELAFYSDPSLYGTRKEGGLFSRGQRTTKKH
jgi:hypothetical protein